MRLFFHPEDSLCGHGYRRRPRVVRHEHSGGNEMVCRRLDCASDRSGHVLCLQNCSLLGVQNFIPFPTIISDIKRLPSGN
jgi:hypothetical protein